VTEAGVDKPFTTPDAGASGKEGQSQVDRAGRAGEHADEEFVPNGAGGDFDEMNLVIGREGDRVFLDPEFWAEGIGGGVIGPSSQDVGISLNVDDTTRLLDRGKEICEDP
jgi:hypothetical protein